MRLASSRRPKKRGKVSYHRSAFTKGTHKAIRITHMIVSRHMERIPNLAVGMIHDVSP